MAAKSRHQSRQQKFFGPFYPEMTLKIFLYLSDVAFCVCNDDVINHTYFPLGVLERCQVSILPWRGFRDTEVQRFSFFPTWLPNHMTYDVIIIIKTFFRNRCTYDENFVSIGYAVAEKTEKTRKRAIRDCKPLPGVLLSGVFFFNRF